MLQQNKLCQQEHQRDVSNYICTYKTCDQQSRWACPQCISSHYHQIKDNKNILSEKEFIQKVNQKYSEAIQNTEKQYITILQIKLIIDQIKSLVKTLISQMDQILYDNKKEEEFYSQVINKINNDKYWQIQDDELLKIMEIDQNKYSSLLPSKTFLLQIIEDCQKIQFIIDEQEDHELKQMKQEKFQNTLNFQTQYTINIAQISHNEQYLVLGGENQELTIKNLKQNKDDLSIKLGSVIKACKFSLNDQYIYFGEISGNLSVYDLEQKELKQIYSKKIHTQAINNIIINQSHIISCSDDMSIIITDIKNKKCILQIQNAHQNSINGLDYDQQNEIIASSSKDLSIKLFNSQNGELKINKQMSHDNIIMQIQFIKQNERLISASFNELKIWQINLPKGQIVNLQSLTQKHIYNFSSIKNDSFIIVVSQNFLNIFDKSLGLVRNFLHNKQENKFLNYYQANQLTSMNYIIIMGQKTCQIWSKHNKS